MTIFQALYGRPLPTIPLYHTGTSPVNAIYIQLTKRDELLQHLKINLQAAINHMQQITNSKRRDIEFQKGDWVFLKLQSYRQHTVFKCAFQKLACRFYGPFQVIQCIGPVAYKLNLPPESRIHPIFHVSMLQKTMGDVTSASETLPPTTDEGTLILPLESGLDTR